VTRKRRQPFIPSDLDADLIDAVLNRSGATRRTFIGPAYYGTPPSYFERWVTTTHDPFGPVEHEDFDKEGFLKGRQAT
jgi:hypothetical protein